MEAIRNKTTRTDKTLRKEPNTFRLPDSTIEQSGKPLIKLMYTNAQSIVNKVSILNALVVDNHPDIIAITESWTHTNINEALLTINGYEIVGRSDRVDTLKGRGGGILVYSRLANTTMDASVHNFCQHVCITAHTQKNVPNIKIHVVYRSPNSTEENDKQLLDYIDMLPKNSVIVGDFNFPEIHWKTLSNKPQ